MSKKRWTVIERLFEHFDEAVLGVGDGIDSDAEDEGDAEAAMALAYPLLMNGLGYALELLGKPERRTFRRLRDHLSQLSPPFSRDYTELFVNVRTFSKKITYFEDDLSVREYLEEIADGVRAFTAEVRAMAVSAGHTAA
jgi:hypothetical protein